MLQGTLVQSAQVTNKNLLKLNKLYNDKMLKRLSDWIKIIKLQKLQKWQKSLGYDGKSWIK